MPWPKGKAHSAEMTAKRTASLSSAGKRHKKPIVVDGEERWLCPRCERWLPRRDFYECKRTPSGLKSQCRSCHTAGSVATRDPERCRRARRESEGRRRARMAGAPILSPETDIRDAMAMLGDACLRCGSRDDIQMDHIVAISKGGPHHAANVQPLCRACNERKQARQFDYRTVEQRTAIEAAWGPSFGATR